MPKVTIVFRAYRGPPELPLSPCGKLLACGVFTDPGGMFDQASYELRPQTASLRDAKP
jgi:hypothetical protein